MSNPDRKFRQGSLAAPDGWTHAVSASRRIAELPWTRISGEFSSRFGQKRPFAHRKIQETRRTGNGLDAKRKSPLEGLYLTHWRLRLDRILSAPRAPLPQPFNAPVSTIEQTGQ